MDDEYFTIPYVIYTIPNSPVGHKLPKQANKNVWIIAINVEEPITAQGVLIKLNCHQNPRENPRSISVYAEVRATKGQILKILVPDLIKSEIWFHILIFISRINLSPQRTFVKLQRVLRENSVKNPYF